MALTAVAAVEAQHLRAVQAEVHSEALDGLRGSGMVADLEGACGAGGVTLATSPAEATLACGAGAEAFCLVADSMTEGGAASQVAAGWAEGLAGSAMMAPWTIRWGLPCLPGEVADLTAWEAGVILGSWVQAVCELGGVSGVLGASRDPATGLEASREPHGSL